MSGWMDRWATEQVPGGVPYTRVLATSLSSPVLSLLGITLGLMTFVVAAPLISQGLALGYWLAVGSPGEFADTYRALTAYELPFGLVVGHLGIAALIPLAAALVLFVHRARPGCLSSVTGRLRWGWLGVCTAIAFGVLGLLLVVQSTVDADATFALNPQSGWWVFWLVMLLTTPWQSAAEEYFFRGYLMQSLGAIQARPWFGVVASAAVFTLFHGTLDHALIVDRFAFGVLAGLLVLRTGGLEAAIGAHIANNVTSFTLAALTSSMAEVKALSKLTWVAAGWDIGRFALYAVLIWWLAVKVNPQRLTDADARHAGLSNRRRVH